MIFDADLKAWLADRAAQRRCEQEADAFGRAWGETAPHVDFDAAMAALPADANVETVAAAARAMLDDDAWVDRLVDRAAAAMRDNIWFEPPFRALHTNIHAGLLTYEDEHLTIAAGVSKLTSLARHKQAGQGKGSVNFTGQVSLLRFPKAGGVTLGFWECDPIGADFHAATAGECRYVGARRIDDGEIIAVDGRREAFVIEHARSNFVVLQASLKTGQAPVGAEYDAETRRFLGCSAVDEGDCRIQMVATLARLLGHEQAFAAIAPFVNHTSFFVRWHAMKELLGIDAGAALPRLKAMAARDPHPDARAAARQVLDRIERPVPPRKAA